MNPEQPTQVIEAQNEAEFIAVLKAMTDRHGILHISADTLIPQLIRGQRAIEISEITMRYMDRAEKAAGAKNWSEFMASFEDYLKAIQAFNARHVTHAAGLVH